MATAVQPRLPVLTEVAQEAFDKYLAAKIKKAKADSTARRAGADKGEAQDLVVFEMGDAMRAQLPDGRIVQRLKKGMHRKAMPARDIAWEELIESE